VKLILLILSFLSLHVFAIAQDKSTSRIINFDDYQKAKTFKIADLDKDTYVKFENQYVLDRYESRKPYFITGDDGKKQRIDLYKLIWKEGMQEIGTVIFYTNENGKLYTACLPSIKAESKIWEQYFTDIHAIDKVEANYVLKLSYVLSKEFSYQQYKGSNQGKDLSKEAGTYGSDICFPGDMMVDMADGSQKMLRTIQPGDVVITVDAVTKVAQNTVVKNLAVHEAKNYAITKILLQSVRESITATATEVQLLFKELAVTPNHPILTSKGEKPAAKVVLNDKILCKEQSGKITEYIVIDVNESAGGIQRVYNMEAQTGTTFMMNGVMVKQKN
jgi:hypothetical protein